MTQKQEDRAGEGLESLDDLFLDAQLAQAAKNPTKKRVADPSLRDSLDAAAKKMRELYTLPENWERTRGIALIDKGTQTLVGNFSEYKHKTIAGTRKLIREHTPIAIDATEVVDGYLGEQFEQRHRGISWEREVDLKADLWFDELMVGCPLVELTIKLRLGALLRVEVKYDTQFASASGATIIRLPAGTNVLEQLSQDTKTHIRRQVSA